jgi:putative hydrolase of the HAD superfamily
LFFDVIVISGEAKVAKPKPEIFKLAAERAQRSPESCWYIGDRLDIDAEASRAVGFNSVWVNRAKQVATGSPNLLVIDDLGSKALREALGVD